MDAKQQRLHEIMSELQSGGLTRRRRTTTTTMRECSIVKRPAVDDCSSLVHYHRLYVDTSGEHFYLPKKWWHHGGSGGGKDNKEWQECNFDYAFKKDEMNGTDLMRNLRWLGQSNKIMKLANNSDNDSSDHNMVDLEDDNSDEGGELVGHGIQPIPTTKKRRRKKSHVDDDRIIQWAMPEMDTTLSNWMLHRQNLGKMLQNYKRQYRDLPPNH